MRQRSPRLHWLRGNKGERTPRRLIVLDTESRVIETEPREVQALRCWVAAVIERPEAGEKSKPWVWASGTEQVEIPAFIEATVKGRNSWRLFTHNLSYDLSLTRLPLHLLERGWRLGKHNLASDQPWAYLSRKSGGLWLCDSWSWLPTSVERLGELLEIPKLELPHEDASAQAWLKRCRRDVLVTATALCRLMDEWDRRNLGWWSITGPASGWNTLLHFPRRGVTPAKEPHVKHSPNPHAPGGSERVLIVPDPQARAFERTALYSGRRDVWQVGNLGQGPWAEIDLKTAHLQICASLPLPYRRWKDFDSLPLDDWRLGTEGAGLVAQVVVRARAPRYPVRYRGAVLHPQGVFQTVLAGPEIIDARERGELVSIGPGYGYHLGHVMRDWAQWALAVLATPNDLIEPLLKVAVKGWSRSVPGRWGMTHARQLKSGPSHIEGWALEPITIGQPPRRGFIFHLAGNWTESVNDQEADDSFPAVLAYIQSHCRLALNRMLDALPEDALASCNTEGAWVADAGLRRICGHGTHTCGNTCSRSDGWRYATEDLSQYTAPLVVQLKQTTRSLQVLSPQHHRTDLGRLYSGIPSAAQEIEPERFNFQTWPKLRGQIEKGDPRGYVRERRTVNLAGLPVSRWAFESGHCEPVELCWSPQTGNVLQPPGPELMGAYGALRALQHPALRGALTDRT